MRHPLYSARGVLAALFVALLAGGAAAQTGRVGGVVKDESGNPIKGATVTAENPNASPSSFTATTDDKGRFSIIGLRSGTWTFTAQAPGFAPENGKMGVQTIGTPNPPMTLTLKKGGAPAGGLAGVAAKDLQADLAAADADYNAGKFDDAIAKYRAIMAKAPTLSVINLQIAAAYRNKKEYDNAIAAYNELLKADPNNDKAKVGLGMTNLEKGDLNAAEETLSAAAQGPSPSREVVPEGDRHRPDLGQADLQAGARRNQQERQGRREEAARKGDSGGPGVAGSHAGKGRSRTIEVAQARVKVRK